MAEISVVRESHGGPHRFGLALCPLQDVYLIQPPILPNFQRDVNIKTCLKNKTQNPQEA